MESCQAQRLPRLIQLAMFCMDCAGEMASGDYAKVKV
jgi:hypothetical protein